MGLKLGMKKLLQSIKKYYNFSIGIHLTIIVASSIISFLLIKVESYLEFPSYLSILVTSFLYITLTFIVVFFIKISSFILIGSVGLIGCAISIGYFTGQGRSVMEAIDAISFLWILFIAIFLIGVLKKFIWSKKNK